MRLRQCSLGSRIRPSAGDHAYLYGPSLTPVAQVDGSGTVEYLHGDVLGSVRAITDSTGAVVGASTFDAFGSRTAHTGTGDSLFGFTGAWTDPAVDSTRQPYAYTGNSPLQRTDPSGLDFIQDVYDNAVNAMVAGSQALNCGLEQVAAFGAGALDSLTFGLSSMVLSAAVPGYDEFVAGHEAAFTAGSITATVVQAAVMITATAGAGAGLAVGLIVLKVALKTAIKSVVKGVERGAVEEAFHYTSSAAARSIAKTGLYPGSFATPNGTLKPLQAQLELALQPNRVLPDALVRIDVTGLRSAGYELPPVGRVSSAVTAGGRTFTMPGGGYQMQFPFAIPSEFLRVVG